MRIDKFLQVSRIVKRRAVAKEIVDKSRVKINDRSAKAGSKVKLEDIVQIRFGDSLITIKVTSINEKTRKDDASSMYEILSNEKKAD